MTKTFQGGIVTNSCDSGFHLVLQGRWWKQVNQTASLKSKLNSEVACKDLCQQKGLSSIKLPSSMTDNPSTPPVLFKYALWVEFIDLQSISSSPFPGRWNSIRLIFCLVKNKLQDENWIKRCVLACSTLTDSHCSPDSWLRKSCTRQLKYCRISESSWPLSFRLCWRYLQMTWALSVWDGERSLREDGFRVFNSAWCRRCLLFWEPCFLLPSHVMWEHMLHISRAQ